MRSEEFIPWFAPVTGEREKELVLEVLESNYLNDGPVTREFEARFAEMLGVRHCVGVTSGTAAITLALMGVGIGPGDEVIVPDLTFIATANAVRLAGATPVLVDVEPRRLAIDPEQVASKISSRTRAIVPVDVNGRGADYAALEAIAKEHGLAIVTDSAEGIGSVHRGRRLGTFCAAGCFSFSAGKTITAGQGGMISTDDDDLCDRLRELKDQGRRTTGTGGNDSHPVMGYNFKLTNLQAAVGLAQLEKLPERLEFARWRDELYRRRLEGCPGVVLPPWDAEGGEVLQWADALIEPRGKVEAAFEAGKIGFRPFWFPLHTQKPYADSEGEFRNAVDISRRGLWLPSIYTLREEDVERVCETIWKAQSE